MILIDNREPPKPEMTVTPGGGSNPETPQTKPAKRSNNSLIIWSIILVVLIVGTIILVNMYNNSQKDGSITGK